METTNNRAADWENEGGYQFVIEVGQTTMATATRITISDLKRVGLVTKAQNLV